MPKSTKRAFRNIPVPTAKVDGDPEKLIEALKDGAVPPEALADLMAYVRRQKNAVVTALGEIEEAISDAAKSYYEGLAEEKRETVRGKAGMITYTAAGKKDEAKDRDSIVASINPEQLRASYKPDLKALKVMLTPGKYRALVKEVDTPAKVTFRDMGGDDYDF